MWMWLCAVGRGVTRAAQLAAGGAAEGLGARPLALADRLAAGATRRTGTFAALYSTLPIVSTNILSFIVLQ